MPSSNDEAFHQDDTPDEVTKDSKQSRKKQKKKTAKQRVSDDSSKDSSSEGPRLSPDLVPTLNPSAPSPPPSHSPSPALVPEPAGSLPSFAPLDQAASPLSKSILCHSTGQHFRAFPPTSEPSPPQDDIMLARDETKPVSRVTQPGSPYSLSLSSSPQGGIQLPTNIAHMRPFAPAPTNTQPPKFQPWNSPSTHMPQRHFSRLAQYDFSKPVPAAKSVLPGENGYYCGFDTWQAHNGLSSQGTSTVILVGWEGGLEVHRQTRQKSDMIGRLEGLPGKVLDAKVLPWTSLHDPLEHLRPLIACVVHGPALALDEDMSQLSTAAVTKYQTVVDVYSLRTSERISRLFQTQPVVIEQPVTSPGFVPPSPIGQLSIEAQGKFVIVSSGLSGEIYVFAVPEQNYSDGQGPFTCIGKYWTAVRTFPPENRINGVNRENVNWKNIRRPVYALSHRWLAVKPPLVSSSQVTLKGFTDLLGNVDPTVLTSHACRDPPSPNCDVDAPLNHSLISRFTKQATQEIYKGAQQGFNALRNYVNRPTNAAGDPAYYGSPHSLDRDQAVFPPTHAQSNESQTSPVESALVSIIDLDRLLWREEAKSKAASAPLATFQLNDGCSFMSFSPDGLFLLATNHIGDESRIWDLTQATDPRAATGDASSVGSVRMVTRFHRVSPSVVVDVAWTSCGSRIAVTTGKGTVHLYGRQSSDAKPLPTLQPGLPSPSTSPRDDGQAGGFMNNVRAGWQSIHGLAKRPQGNSGGFVSTLGNASAAARYAGGKAVRQGLTRGLGIAAEGAHNIRHAEDNKIRLRSSRYAVSAGCVQWLHGKDKDVIATMSDGKVTLLAVRNISHTQNKKTVVTPAVIKKPLTEISLQAIPSDVVPPAVLGLLDAQGPHAACAKDGLHGFCFWDDPPNDRRAYPGVPSKRAATAPAQDKETNPPYMPFHRLPHVNLFTLTESNDESTVEDDKTDEVWTFGMPMASSTKINCQQSSAEEAYLADLGDDDDVEGLIGQMDETLRGEMAGNGHERRDLGDTYVDG